MIHVYEYDGELARRRWTFGLSSALYGNSRMVLNEYAEETRPSTRHRKWIGPKWDAQDERPYNSQLSRPTDVPDWVIKEALRQMPVDIFIGWTNLESKLKTYKISAV
jgi:hypothetical protein